jgi:hypothetical protein
LVWIVGIMAACLLSQNTLILHIGLLFLFLPLLAAEPWRGLPRVLLLILIIKSLLEITNLFFAIVAQFFLDSHEGLLVPNFGGIGRD